MPLRDDIDDTLCLETGAPLSANALIERLPAVLAFLVLSSPNAVSQSMNRRTK